MNTIQQAIIERLSQLSEMQQRQVLEFADRLPQTRDTRQITLIAWLDQARQLRQELSAESSAGEFDTYQTLNEIRDEEFEWPRNL